MKRRIRYMEPNEANVEIRRERQPAWRDLARAPEIRNLVYGSSALFYVAGGRNSMDMKTKKTIMMTNTNIQIRDIRFDRFSPFAAFSLHSLEQDSRPRGMDRPQTRQCLCAGMLSFFSAATDAMRGATPELLSGIDDFGADLNRFPFEFQLAVLCESEVD